MLLSTQFPELFLQNIVGDFRIPHNFSIFQTITNFQSKRKLLVQNLQTILRSHVQKVLEHAQLPSEGAQMSLNRAETVWKHCNSSLELCKNSAEKHFNIFIETNTNIFWGYFFSRFVFPFFEAVSRVILNKDSSSCLTYFQILYSH